MRSSAGAGVTERAWVVRGEAPATVLVPRSAPLPTLDDVADAYARGRDEGRRDAEAERAHAVLALRDACAQERVELAHHRERTHAATTIMAVELATTLARWLVCEAVAADPDLMRARVERALDAVADQRELRVVVAPAMVELVASWVDGDVTVDADAALAAGELRIDAGHAALDATFDTALARARDALVQSLDMPSPREDPCPR
jgi:flagellar biosynthesis/type III secretory pathway protein FliH